MHGWECLCNVICVTLFQSWDLLENILESENSSRQILDHLKIFFNFLLGTLQRRGTDIVDIFMLWTLLDTEGVNTLFLDTITGFGFKKKDVDNIRLLLSVVCKDHKKTIEGDREKVKSKVDAKDDTVVDDPKKSVRKEADDNTNDPKQKALEAGREVKLTETMIPLHDHSVEDLLKKWEANEGINIFGMDEELRTVLKRMIAVVIFTLNIGQKAVTGLYDIDNQNNSADSMACHRNKTMTDLRDLYDLEIMTENTNNSAVIAAYDGQVNDVNMTGRDGAAEKKSTCSMQIDNSRGCLGVECEKDIKTTLNDMNNNVTTDNVNVNIDEARVPSLKELVLDKIAKDAAVNTAGNKKDATNSLNYSAIYKEIKINQLKQKA